MSDAVYRPDLSLKGKLRRRIVRLRHRRAAVGSVSRPMLSFTFDDISESAASAGARALEARGLRATFFVCAGLADATGHMGRYAGRTEITALASAGHEIGCHTFSHLDCGRADAAAVTADLDRNAQALAEWGLPAPQTFAYPYGDVASPVKRLAGERFRLARALHAGALSRGADMAQAPSVGLDDAAGPDRARAWMARTADRGGWLLFYTHAVSSEGGEFGVKTPVFEAILDEAVGRGFDIVTAAEGARRLSKT